MKVTFKHLGTVFIPEYPISSEKDAHIGKYKHVYLVSSDTGLIDKIIDNDCLPDGEYNVEENFFDTVTPYNEVDDD